jgi:hypothetical protein
LTVKSHLLHDKLHSNRNDNEINDRKAVGCKLYFLAKIARFEIDNKTDFIKRDLVLKL